MLGNNNAELDKLIEERVTSSSWKWNRVFLWKNQQEKEEDFFLKNIVTNAREFGQLTETLK